MDGCRRCEGKGVAMGELVAENSCKTSEFPSELELQRDEEAVAQRLASRPCSSDEVIPFSSDSEGSI